MTIRTAVRLLAVLLLLPAAVATTPPDLSSFYSSFDTDTSGSLDLEEAQTFYQWVQDNIQYRYDDESDLDGLMDLDYGDITSDQLGDGRAGVEYSQTPLETYTERMGDCEDTAIFSAAFYAHHGIEAYIADIDTDASDRLDVDHATCIALLPDAEEPDYDYFELGGDRFLIIDNTYSDRFGCIDAEDIYQLVDIHTVEAELRLNSVYVEYEGDENRSCVGVVGILLVLTLFYAYYRRLRGK